MKKAILMDLFQIGELINSLSENIKQSINHNDIRGIINIRNFIAHGYVVLDDHILWDSITKKVPDLMICLKAKINEL